MFKKKKKWHFFGLHPTCPNSEAEVAASLHAHTAKHSPGNKIGAQYCFIDLIYFLKGKFVMCHFL